MDFMAAPETVKELGHELGVDRNVLRWMTIKRSSKVSSSGGSSQ
jgi:ribosomal protein S6